MNGRQDIKRSATVPLDPAPATRVADEARTALVRRLAPHPALAAFLFLVEDTDPNMLLGLVEMPKLLVAGSAPVGLDWGGLGIGEDWIGEDGTSMRPPCG